MDDASKFCKGKRNEQLHRQGTPILHLLIEGKAHEEIGHQTEGALRLSLNIYISKMST